MTRPPRAVGLATRILTTRALLAPLRPWARQRIIEHNPAASPLGVRRMRQMLVSGGAVGRALLLRWTPAPLRPQDVLQAVDSPALIGPAAILLTELDLAPGELSSAVGQAITLELAGDASRTQAALTAVRRAPTRMLQPQRNAIFARAWMLARQPIDPYQPNALHHAARSAAAALLAEHPQLRLTALPDLASPAYGRQLQLVYAAALQATCSDIGDVFSETLATLNPTQAQALMFARDCDRDFSAADPLESPDTTNRWSTARWLLRLPGLPAVRGVLALLIAPALGAACALAVTALWRTPHHLPLDTGLIVAVAGILVAIHVFAAELAAERLPGLVARATSMPLPLWAGYGSIAALYILAVWHPRGHEAQTRDRLAAGVIVSLVVSLIVALRQLLSRTDSAVAARLFAGVETRRATRSGAQVGRMHASVVQARAMLSSMAWVRPTSSAPLSMRSLPVTVHDDGYLILRTRTLTKLDRDAWWHTGARVWLFGTPGALVHPADAVASLVAPPDETIAANTRKEVGRLFDVRRQRDSERTAEALCSLIEMTVELANAGNEAADSRVARETVGVLSAHLRARAEARGPLPEGETGAPVVASRAAAFALAGALARAERPATREALTGLVRRALSHCSKGDPFLPTLIIQLGEFGPATRGDPDVARGLLWDCGRRVIDLSNLVIARLWWDNGSEPRLGTRSSGTGARGGWPGRPICGIGGRARRRARVVPALRAA